MVLITLKTKKFLEFWSVLERYKYELVMSQKINIIR